MNCYRQALQNSWVPTLLSSRDLARLLRVPLPACMSTLIQKLKEPESITLSTEVITPEGIPLGGWVELTIRSDGNYTFKGSIDATGLFSYHFGLQVFIKAADGLVIAAFHSGSVFGWDTPGKSNNFWEENLNSPLLVARWASIRNNPRIDYQFHADITGITGTLWDILKVGLKAIIGYITAGPVGAVIVIGTELGSAVGVPAPPGLVAGVVVTGGVILIFGPGLILPAVVAGAAVGIGIELSIKNRLIREDEKEFARLIFGNILDEKFRNNKVWLTNLSHGGGAKFTIPNLEGSILVNLDDAYSDPIHYVDPKVVSDYKQPGSVFIHELTHACQIAVNKFVPGMICNAPGTYDYHPVDKTEAKSAEDQRLDRDKLQWASLSWPDDFTREQQAHIVDDWYGAYCGNFSSLGELNITLNHTDAINDPAFQFIIKCRAGIF